MNKEDTMQIYGGSFPLEHYGIKTPKKKKRMTKKQFWNQVVVEVFTQHDGLIARPAISWEEHLEQEEKS